MLLHRSASPTFFLASDARTSAAKSSFVSSKKLSGSSSSAWVPGAAAPLPAAAAACAGVGGWRGGWSWLLQHALCRLCGPQGGPPGRSSQQA